MKLIASLVRLKSAEDLDGTRGRHCKRQRIELETSGDRIVTRHLRLMQ